MRRQVTFTKKSATMPTQGRILRTDIWYPTQQHWITRLRYSGRCPGWAFIVQSYSRYVGALVRNSWVCSGAR
jgi:hypothetical protein